MKVWMIIFLLQRPDGLHQPAFKTVATFEECMIELSTGLQSAAEERIPIRGKCVAYDGKNEDLVALRVAVEMAEGN